MISKETASKIYCAYREIEVAEKLLEDIAKVSSVYDADKNAPTIEDLFGRRRHFQIGIPSGESGHRLYDVRPELAVSCIRAHIGNKKSELCEANEQAKLELAL